MTWTAPDINRVDEHFVADERTTLEEFLDWYRATLLHKCAGLTGEQLAERAVPPSNLSLLGLVRHMTDVERSWFRIRFGGEEIPRLYDRGDQDPDFDEATPAAAQADYAALVSEIDLCRAATAGHDLDETFLHPRIGKQISLRWVYVHMIEEYARHAGHADLLRERVDGSKGS
jgi:uncharacterized damage-inducible protein DinB